MSDEKVDVEREILDSIKEILGVRNDRDIVPVLRNNNQIMNLIEGFSYGD